MTPRMLCLLAAACGAPRGVPPSHIAPPAHAPAPVTCADAGVILRGPLEDADDDSEAARDRELAIATVCEQTAWPVAVLECIGTQPDARPCLGKLSEPQLARYLDVVGPPVTIDGGVVQAPTCKQAVRDPGLYPPPLGDDHSERAWALGARHRVLEHECEHGWSEELRACVHEAADAVDVSACTRQHLAADELDELVDELTAIDALAAKIAKAREKPATLGCKRVVAAHYGDARWRHKLDGFSAAERKKMIAASRAKMLEACTRDAWDESLRACILVGGDRRCFEAARMSLEWGYPAAGTVASLGIADCDAYGAAIASLMRCDQLPQDSRDALLQGFDAMKAHIASQPRSVRAKLASSCKAGLDAVRQIATGVGC